MLLASISSISCNIQHLAQQQSQHKLQWSIIRKRTFPHIQQAYTANRRSVPHHNVIKRRMARVAAKQKEFEPLGHCVVCDPKRSVWPRNNMKCAFQAMKRKRNGSWIMSRERWEWEDSELKTLRQRFSRTRKICGKLQMGVWRPESPTTHCMRW